MAWIDRAALLALFRTTVQGSNRNASVDADDGILDDELPARQESRALFDGMDNGATDAELSTWKGIEVDDEGRVVSLILRFQCLEGTTKTKVLMRTDAVLR